MASSEMEVINYDGERVTLKDLKDGDLLLGVTGECLTVRDVHRGTDYLYRINFSHRRELLLAPHASVSILKRMAKGAQSRDGPTVEDHLEVYAQKFGPLPDPLTSEAGDEDGEKIKRVQRADFWSALRTAIKWQLTFPRTENAARQLRNYLNGCKGIQQNPSSYRFQLYTNGVKSFEIFSWGNPARGKAPKAATWFDSREDAFQAVVARSRQVHNSGIVTIANLAQRFDAAGDDHVDDRVIKLDENLPGIDLMWRKGKTGLSLRANGTYDGVHYTRYFAFPDMPRTDLLPTAVIPDSEDDFDDQGDDTAAWLTKVIAGAQAEVLTVDVQTLPGLNQTQKSKFWLYSSPGSEWPFQQVPVDPYFFGLWLGDGTRANTTISSNHEPEIREFLVRHAASLDLHLVHYGRIAYATVANPRPGTSTGDALPPTLPTFRAWRPDRPNYRKAIIERRLAEGWTFQANRKKGEKRVWQRPNAVGDAQPGANTTTPPAVGLATTAFDPDTHTRPEGGAASDYESSSQAHPKDTLGDYNGVGALPSALPTQPLLRKRMSGAVPTLASSSPTSAPAPDVASPTADSGDELPTLDTAYPRMKKQSETTVGEQLLSDPAIQDLAGTPQIPFAQLTEDDNDATFTDGSEYDDDDVHIITTHDMDGTALTSLATGLSAYGELDQAEEDDLVDDLVADVTDASDNVQQPRKVNTLLRAMRDLDILTPVGVTGGAADKKHVPQLYKKNTREIRLAVLAGMIDSDGHYAYMNNSIVIGQSEYHHARLFWDIVQLAQSLGYSVTTFRSMTPTGWGLRMDITGEIARIPCLLLRKQAPEHLQATRAGYSLKEVTQDEDESEWTSFRLSGNELYLRADNIVLTAVPRDEADPDVDMEDAVEELPPELRLNIYEYLEEISDFAHKHLIVHDNHKNRHLKPISRHPAIYSACRIIRDEISPLLSTALTLVIRSYEFKTVTGRGTHQRLLEFGKLPLLSDCTYIGTADVVTILIESGDEQSRRAIRDSVLASVRHIVQLFEGADKLQRVCFKNTDWIFHELCRMICSMQCMAEASVEGRDYNMSMDELRAYLKSNDE